MTNKVIIRPATTADISTIQGFILEQGKSPWNFLPEKEVKTHIAEIANSVVLQGQKNRSDQVGTVSKDWAHA